MHGKTADLFLRLGVIDKIPRSHLQIFLCLVAFLYLLLPWMCSAEVFKYVDDDGIAHFSNSPGDVPKGRQVEIEGYQESQSFNGPGKESFKKEETKEVPEKKASEAAPMPATHEKDLSDLEALGARKTSLDVERSQLENELAEVMERGQTQRVTRAIWRVNADLKVVVEGLAEHQEKRDAFEKEWEECHGLLEDSPEVEELEERKADLESERMWLQERLSELAAKHQRQINQRREIRWYKVDLREINERFVEYQKERDAFERDRDAYFSSP